MSRALAVTWASKFSRETVPGREGCCAAFDAATNDRLSSRPGDITNSSEMVRLTDVIEPAVFTHSSVAIGCR